MTSLRKIRSIFTHVSHYSTDDTSFYWDIKSTKVARSATLHYSLPRMRSAKELTFISLNLGGIHKGRPHLGGSEGESNNADKSRREGRGLAVRLGAH